MHLKHGYYYAFKDIKFNQLTILKAYQINLQLNGEKLKYKN